jgi:hypothetical protein
VATEQERRIIEHDLDALKLILEKLDKIADKLPAKLMATDVARNGEEAIRIQQTYVVLKETIPKMVSGMMNAEPVRDERWSFWKWLKQ